MLHNKSSTLQISILQIENTSSYFQTLVDSIIEEVNMAKIKSYQEDFVFCSYSFYETIEKLEFLQVFQSGSLTRSLAKYSFHNIAIFSRAPLLHGQFRHLPKAPGFVGPTNCSIKNCFYLFQYIYSFLKKIIYWKWDQILNYFGKREVFSFSTKILLFLFIIFMLIFHLWRFIII